MKYAADPFKEGLSYHDRLPLSWEVLSALPDSSVISRLNERNDSLLQSLMISDDKFIDVDPDLEPLAMEIQRLDQKMTLLTELLSDLLRGQLALPAETTLRIAAEGVSWVNNDDVLPQGQFLKLDLYLLPDVPRALQFIGRVISAEPSRVEPACRITVSFVGLSDAVDSQLGKLVFRHHRREVAMARIKAD
jgi:hypothetical protein